MMNANSGWRYGLDDVRGYESIIPSQYVEYMQTMAVQGSSISTASRPFSPPTGRLRPANCRG